MFCSKCGKDMRDNALFCPSCGFSVGKSEIHGKVKLFLSVSLALNCIKAAAAVLVLVLTFTMKNAITSYMPYADWDTVFLWVRFLCGMISVITLASGLVTFFMGMSRRVRMSDNFAFFRNDHIISFVSCGIGAFFTGVLTAFIRDRMGAESVIGIFSLFMFLLIMALIHIFMAMLPEELTKLDNAGVSESRAGGKLIFICSITALAVLAVIFTVICFIFSGIGMNGKYGHYMESENRYGYIIEFDAGGSCLLEQVYSSEIVSGVLEKNHSNSYSINWDRYYGTWIVKRQGDTLLVSGMGLGDDGVVFERIE